MGVASFHAPPIAQFRLPSIAMPGEPPGDCDEAEATPPFDVRATLARSIGVGEGVGVGVSIGVGVAIGVGAGA